MEECPHDQEEVFEGLPSERVAEESTDTVDMVAVRSIPAAVEVFNTYGAHLGNAALLARYGFLLDGCGNDSVTFGWFGSGVVVDNEPAEWVELYENVKNGLEPLIDVSPSLYQPGDDRKEPCLSVNSDGQASLGFFVWAARKAALPRLQGVSDSAMLSATAELVTRSFSVLLQAEVRSTMVDELDIDPITDTLVSSDVNLP